ncbi:MAG: hypothetical protein KatS3mg087_2202 [Patescibacteria group bacterium]|nr:MAG: hypothetical protein KatS3mg087_2202 [Patescibacteria group bacterium]
MTLLERFTSDNPESRFYSPFLAAGKNVATDGAILVATPPVMPDLKDRTKDVESIYPVKETLAIGKTYISDIDSCLASFPKVMKTDEEEIMCDACEGGGEVYWVFDYNGVVYEEESYCPVCMGQGFNYKVIETGEMIYDKSKSISIHGFTISAEMLNNLKFIADTLGEEHVNLYLDTEDRFLFAEVGEVEVAIARFNINDVYSKLNVV